MPPGRDALPRACRKSLAIARSGEHDGVSCRLSPRCCSRSRILGLEAAYPRNTVQVWPISVHERGLSAGDLGHEKTLYAAKEGEECAQNTQFPAFARSGNAGLNALTDQVPLKLGKHG
jgi:hypothetical protein